MKTEDLASELGQELARVFYGGGRGYSKSLWDKVGKHVRRMLIDRAIEELDMINTCDIDHKVQARIAELRKERDAL